MKQIITNNLATWTTAPKGIKKLRELILELAVRGLLVPQDTNDEPASELLKKIAAEKARLVSEGKIKPPKPLAKISEEEKPFALPMGWEWVRLGELGQIFGGGTPTSDNSEYFSEKEIAWLTPADLYNYNRKFIERGRRDISELGLKKSSAQLMPTGTVLFSSRAPIGYIVIASNPIATNQGFKSCSPYLVQVNQYIYCFLKSSVKKIEENATGTTFKEISGKTFGLIVIPLPPLAEQQRIVAKVDELMQLCDQLEEKQSGSQAMHRQLVSCLLTTLTEATDAQAFQAAWSRIAANFDCLFTTEHSIEQLKQTILQLAVMGKLVPQNPTDEPASELLKKIATEKARLITEGKIKKQNPLSKISEQEKPFVLPNGWEWVRLNDIVSLLGDGLHGTPDYDKTGEFFFINGNNLSDGIIEIKDHTKRVSLNEFQKHQKELNERTVFVSINGTIGNVAFYNSEKIILGKSACYFNLFEEINKHYLCT
jgi:type I restriction enzyme S subunit